MKQHLFVFGFEAPLDRAANERFDGDQESSNAAWIEADNESDALSKGQVYAEEFVGRLYREAGATRIPSWTADGYAHWICAQPLEQFSGIALETFPVVGCSDSNAG
jgi:hypothetical protein